MVTSPVGNDWGEAPRIVAREAHQRPCQVQNEVPAPRRKGADPMQSEYRHLHNHNHDIGNAGEDRATAILLTGGGNDGMPAFFLRHWGPGADPPSRCCHLAAGRRPFLPDSEVRPLLPARWTVACRHRVGPLEQARIGALSIRETLQERLNHPMPISPAGAFCDTDPDGASSAWPDAAASRCSGTWRAAPVIWPMLWPQAGSASPWSG